MSNEGVVAPEEDIDDQLSDSASGAPAFKANNLNILSSLFYKQ